MRDYFNDTAGALGLSPRTTGIVYLLVSSISFSFAGVFIKGVETGSWGVIFWRAGFGFLFLIIFYSAIGKFRRQVSLKSSGVMISLIAVVMVTLFVRLLRVYRSFGRFGNVIHEISTGCWRVVSKIISAHRSSLLRSAVSPS